MKLISSGSISQLIPSLLLPTCRPGIRLKSSTLKTPIYPSSNGTTALLNIDLAPFKL